MYMYVSDKLLGETKPIWVISLYEEFRRKTG